MHYRRSVCATFLNITSRVAQPRSGAGSPWGWPSHLSFNQTGIVFVSYICKAPDCNVSILDVSVLLCLVSILNVSVPLCSLLVFSMLVCHCVTVSLCQLVTVLLWRFFVS